MMGLMRLLASAHSIELEPKIGSVLDHGCYFGFACENVLMDASSASRCSLSCDQETGQSRGLYLNELFKRRGHCCI